MLKDFKNFVMRGNVVDMAVGVIIGAAFGKIVSSLVSDVLLPPIGRITGGVDFSNLYINLTNTPYNSLAQAQQAGAATVNYGIFLNNVINFFIVSGVLFILIMQVNKLKTRFEDKAAPNTKECPFCLSSIPLKAVKCAHCTSEVPAGK